MSINYRLLITGLLVALSGCDGFNPAPQIATKMADELSYTNKYAERMTQHILDKPDCQIYKDQLLQHGREAVSMNGGFTHLIIETKNAANKAGCSK